MKKTKRPSPVSDELIDEWLKHGRKPEVVTELLKQITKRVVERAMQGEAVPRGELFLLEQVQLELVNFLAPTKSGDLSKSSANSLMAWV